MNSNGRHKVAIVITTRNRSDFLIRQLKYYSDMQSTHTIYIGDCSTEPGHEPKTKGAVEKYKNKINIVYNKFPGSITPTESTYRLLGQVKEKYSCFNGDDDFHIPDALSECGEFLDSNSDYSTSTSLVVNFKLNEPGAYGTIKSLKDYPRPEIHSNTASERIVKFFDRYFVTNISVNRTDEMLKSWSNYNNQGLTDLAFASEIIPGALSLINGKAKTLNRLGVVRQMHDRQYRLDFVYDWITKKDWPDNYQAFSEILSKSLAEKDNISLETAEEIIKKGFWLYLQKSLIREYSEAFPGTIIRSKKILNPGLRKKMVESLPFLKTIYRRFWLSKINKKPQLHYEVLQKDSKYYKDFKPVLDSFTSKVNR